MELPEHQQRKLAELLTQTPKGISQRLTTNWEMQRQHWSLNVEFVRLGKWRKNVAEEMVINRGNQPDVSGNMNQIAI